MKKTALRLLLSIIALLLAVSTASCSNGIETETPTDDHGFYSYCKAAYDKAVAAGYNGSLQDWIGDTLFTRESTPTSPEEITPEEITPESIYKTAYNKARENGFEGSYDQWFDTYFGKDFLPSQGKEPDGRFGEEAYAMAVAYGYSGSYEDWLNIFKSSTGYVLITDYVGASSGRDVSEEIQRAIDENPNRTIYFPDGVYLISKPIVTPASPSKSVSLKLSYNAIIRASIGWKNVCTDFTNTEYNGELPDAMIRLGGKNSANNIYQNGSNYFLEGGIIDCNGIANAVSIDSGRETRISDTVIKNAEIGIFIKHGANNGSSDADITNVSILCNGSGSSVGIKNIGYDNTVTDVNIINAHLGIHNRGGGDMRDIYINYIVTTGEYSSSVGFWAESSTDLRNVHCEQFATAFKFNNSISSVTNCTASWHSDHGPQTAFDFSTFNSIINSPKVIFNRDAADCTLIDFTSRGKGILSSPMFDASQCANDQKKQYTQLINDSDIIPLKEDSK